MAADVVVEGTKQQGALLQLSSPAEPDCNFNHSPDMQPSRKKRTVFAASDKVDVVQSVMSNTDSLQDSPSDIRLILDYVGVTDGIPEFLPATNPDMYRDLAMKFDANLAELDMETFRTEDINAVLRPGLYDNGFEDLQDLGGGEDLSPTDSSLYKFDLCASLQCSDSIDMSISRSQLQFSPVAYDDPLPPVACSTDSLDRSSLGERVMQACQAHKSNYMLAFADSVRGSGSEAEFAGNRSSENWTTWLTNAKVSLPGSEGSSKGSSMQTSESGGSRISSLCKITEPELNSAVSSGNNNHVLQSVSESDNCDKAKREKSLKQKLFSLNKGDRFMVTTWSQVKSKSSPTSETPAVTNEQLKSRSMPELSKMPWGSQLLAKDLISSVHETLSSNKISSHTLPVYSVKNNSSSLDGKSQDLQNFTLGKIFQAARSSKETSNSPHSQTDHAASVETQASDLATIEFLSKAALEDGRIRSLIRNLSCSQECDKIGKKQLVVQDQRFKKTIFGSPGFETGCDSIEPGRLQETINSCTMKLEKSWKGPSQKYNSNHFDKVRKLSLAEECEANPDQPCLCRETTGEPCYGATGGDYAFNVTAQNHERDVSSASNLHGRKALKEPVNKNLFSTNYGCCVSYPCDQRNVVGSLYNNPDIPSRVYNTFPRRKELQTTNRNCHRTFLNLAAAIPANKNNFIVNNTVNDDVFGGTDDDRSCVDSISGSDMVSQDNIDSNCSDIDDLSSEGQDCHNNDHSESSDSGSSRGSSHTNYEFLHNFFVEKSSESAKKVNSNDRTSHNGQESKRHSVSVTCSIEEDSIAADVRQRYKLSTDSSSNSRQTNDLGVQDNSLSNIPEIDRFGNTPSPVKNGFRKITIRGIQTDMKTTCYNSITTSVKNCSTQYPPSLIDRALQTSLDGIWSFRKRYELADGSTQVPMDVMATSLKLELREIQPGCFYSNRSLPDLTFLRNLSGSTVTCLAASTSSPIMSLETPTKTFAKTSNTQDSKSSQISSNATADVHVIASKHDVANHSQSSSKSENCVREKTETVSGQPSKVHSMSAVGSPTEQEIVYRKLKKQSGEDLDVKVNILPEKSTSPESSVYRRLTEPCKTSRSTRPTSYPGALLPGMVPLWSPMPITYSLPYYYTENFIPNHPDWNSINLPVHHHPSVCRTSSNNSNSSSHQALPAPKQSEATSANNGAVDRNRSDSTANDNRGHSGTEMAVDVNAVIRVNTHVRVESNPLVECKSVSNTGVEENEENLTTEIFSGKGSRHQWIADNSPKGILRKPCSLHRRPRSCEITSEYGQPYSLRRRSLQEPSVGFPKLADLRRRSLSNPIIECQDSESSITSGNCAGKVDYTKPMQCQDHVNAPDDKKVSDNIPGSGCDVSSVARVTSRELTPCHFFLESDATSSSGNTPVTPSTQITSNLAADKTNFAGDKNLSFDSDAMKDRKNHDCCRSWPEFPGYVVHPFYPWCVVPVSPSCPVPLQVQLPPAHSVNGNPSISEQTKNWNNYVASWAAETNRNGCNGSCTCTTEPEPKVKKSVSFNDKISIQHVENMSPEKTTSGNETPKESPETDKRAPLASTLPVRPVKGAKPLLQPPIREESPSPSTDHAATFAAGCPDGQIYERESSPEQANEVLKMSFTQQPHDVCVTVTMAVDVLITHFNQAADPYEKVKLGSSNITPNINELIMQRLVPAIYGIMSHGLRATLPGFFTPIKNSTWKVVEASAQIGPSTRIYHELVVQINDTETKSNDSKFSAFVLGLLNAKSLEAWLCYMKQQESLLRKYYTETAFLRLSNTQCSQAFNELVVAVQPLAVLPFDLNIFLHPGTVCLETNMNLTQEKKASTPAKPPRTTLPVSKVAAVRSPAAKPVVPPKPVRIDSTAVCTKESNTRPQSLKPFSAVKPYQTNTITSGGKKGCKEDALAAAVRTSPQEPQVPTSSPDAFSLATLTTSMSKKWRGFGTNIIKTIDKLITSPTADGELVKPVKVYQPNPTVQKSPVNDLKTTIPVKQDIAKVVKQSHEHSEQNGLVATKNCNGGITADSRMSTSSVSSQEQEQVQTPDSEDTANVVKPKKWSRSRKQSGTKIPMKKKTPSPVNSTTSPLSDRPPETVKLFGKHFKHAKAICEHIARRETNELTFEKGAVLTVLHDIDRDWMRCQYKNKVGLVPKKCVKGY